MSPSVHAQAAPAASQRWALLIGIDQYKDQAHISGLSTAVADARALKKALIEASGFPEDHIKLLVSDARADDPTHEAAPERNNILRELANLARHAQSGDLVFIFYSGHGFQIGEKPYLLPYDADAFDEATLSDTCIEVEKFRDRLKTIPAQALLLALDMCRNNPFTHGKGVDLDATGNLLKASQVRGLDFNTSAPNASSGPKMIATLYSCSEGEHSYEWLDRKRGYFSYFLEQGLRGAKDATDSKGVVRLSALLPYIAKQVTDTVQQNEGGKVQKPFDEITGQTAVAAGSFALSLTASSAEDSNTAVIPRVTDPRARLRLTGIPKDPHVFIDGKEIKPVADTYVIDLGGQPSKLVELGIAADGFEAKVQQITLTRGTLIPLSVSLEKAKNPAPATAPSTTTGNTLAASNAVSHRIGGFLLGCQSSSFARFSASEAIEKTSQTGCKYIEIALQNKVSDPLNILFDHDLSDAFVTFWKEKLAAYDIQPIAMGVVRNFGQDEISTRRSFEFARRMGIKTITIEPDPEAMGVIEKLVREYDIRVAIHDGARNTANPSYRFWDPNYVLSLVQGRDSRIGACADTGHWVRSGVKPVAALQLLRGRILDVHLKDVTEFKRMGQDTPFGTGVADVKGILDELKRQNYDGPVSIEYEHNMNNSLPEIIQCVDFVRSYGATQPH